MNISLTPELERFIKSKLQTGLYTSVSEIVRESLRLMHSKEQGSKPIQAQVTTSNQQSYIDELKKMVVTFFKRQPVKVYLFGSRARGDAGRTSDVDIAIEAIKPIKSTLLSKLKTELEESSIPYKVDIVNLNTASKALIKTVKKEGVLWKDYNKG
jgi:uncharacterized protein